MVQCAFFKGITKVENGSKPFENEPFIRIECTLETCNHSYLLINDLFSVQVYIVYRMPSAFIKMYIFGNIFEHRDNYYATLI